MSDIQQKKVQQPFSLDQEKERRISLSSARQAVQKSLRSISSHRATDLPASGELSAMQCDLRMEGFKTDRGICGSRS
jgi:hypothetical protein